MSLIDQTPQAPVRDESLIPLVTARIIGVVPGSAVDVDLRAFLRQRHCLIVLDNVEHLPSAGPWVSEILQACPHLKIVATSRSALHISGEHLYRVQPLTLPDPEGRPDVDELPAHDAVRLFVERAQANSSDFTLSRVNVSDVVEICRRLDGLPLAIELAASRVGSLSLTSLRERIEHRLAILTGGPRDAPDRQQTMRATIDWSFDLLNQPEQALFNRLGVFVNGFTLEAAEAIGGPDTEAVETLTSLIANNLVRLIPDDDGISRYSILETVREYALEQLARSGEEEAVRGAHARYFLSLAEGAIPHYDGPAAERYGRVVEDELDNCRAVLGWALAGGEREIAIRLSGALHYLWWRFDAAVGQPWAEQIDEGRGWMERALESREGFPVSVVTEALIGAAAYARLQGDHDQAQAWAEDLLHRAELEENAYGRFSACLEIGDVAVVRGDLESAKHWFDTALAMAPMIRDPDNQASLALLRLGGIALREGRLELAEQYLRNGLAHCRISGNQYIGIQMSRELGRVVRDRGDLVQAAALLTECLDWFTDVRSQMEQNIVLTDLAVVAILAGQEEQAVHLLAAAALLPVFVENRIAAANEITRVHGAVDGPLFDSAWREGQELSWDEVRAVVESLIEHLSDGRSAPNARPESLAKLTPREVDVLRLVTEGRSNRSIADALSLSERTVENHVRHILDKLNLDTRTAAATFAVRHGLA